MNKVTTVVRGAGFVLALVLASTLAGSSAARASVAFTVIDLGTLGGSTSQPADVNVLGQVVGVSALQGDGVQHAFLYDGTAPRGGGSVACSVRLGRL